MRGSALLVLTALLPTSPAVSQALPVTDQAGAFRAAGFRQEGGQWRGCGDPGTASYAPGRIEAVRDLNGDTRPDAVITEGSAFCFGQAETGFVLVSKRADGKWQRIAGGPGVPTFLTTKGQGGWPDIEIGGPGFCFPVERWNGKQYVLHRHQYEGKPCQPQR